MKAKRQFERVLQASSADLNELDGIYSRANPVDPDRALYKIISKYNLGNVFIVRKGGKIISAAYTIGFPTGSSCVGGIFLDKNAESTETVLAVIRRCLEHLSAKGFDYVFSSVREKSITLYQALRAAGFIELYQRQMGLATKIGKLHQTGDQNTKLLDKSEARAVLEQFSKSENCSEKGTFLYSFWPHSLSDKSIDFLINSDIMAISDKDKGNVVFAHIASAEYAGGRWFILPPKGLLVPAIGSRKVGEVILTIGDNITTNLYEAINRLAMQGIDRICASNYGDANNLSVFYQVGFKFEQPQVILARKADESWPAKEKSAESLDTFF